MENTITLLQKHLPEPLLRRTIEISLLIFLFFQPFVHHTAAIRSISFVTALATWLLMLVLYRQKAWHKNPLSIYLLIYAAVAVISTALGIEHGIGFKALKSSLLYQLGIYYIVINTVESHQQIRRILYVLVLGFSLLTLLGFIESIPVGMKYYSYEYKNLHSRIIDGYSLISTFYIPLTLGVLILEEKKWLKWLIGLSLISQGLVVYLYETRAAIIASLAGMLLLLILIKRYKWILSSALAAVAAIFIMSFMKPAEMQNKLERYQSIFTLETYLGNSNSLGLSGRTGLWRASLDMTKDRPWLGYGYGYKKFALVATKEKYLNKWKDSLPITYAEFASPKPHSNPHNLFLGILFETGIIGLVAFLSLWGNLIGRLISRTQQIRPEKDRLLLYGIVLGTSFSFFIMNLMNSLWYGIVGKLIAVVIGLGALFLNENGFLTSAATLPNHESN